MPSPRQTQKKYFLAPQAIRQSVKMIRYVGLPAISSRVVIRILLMTLAVSRSTLHHGFVSIADAKHCDLKPVTKTP